MTRPRIGTTWRILHDGRVYEVEVEAVEKNARGVFVRCLPAKAVTGKRVHYRKWPWRGLTVPLSAFTNAETHLRKAQNVERFVDRLRKRLAVAEEYLAQVKADAGKPATEHVPDPDAPRMFTVTELMRDVK